MPKPSGRVVQEIIHEQSGERAQIRLDMKTMVFSCDFGDEHFESKDGALVAKQAAEALDRTARLEWTPVLEIVVREGEREDDGATAGDASCALRFRRLYLTKSSGGFREVSWSDYTDDDPVATTRASKPMTIGGSNVLGAFAGQVPYTDRGPYQYDKRVYAEREMLRTLLPYDEATFVALLSVGETLRKARANLITLALSDRDGVASLAQAKAVLLTISG